MRKLCGAEVLKAPATRKRMNVYLVFEVIFSAKELTAYLFPFPLKPIRDMRELGYSILSFEASVLLKIPSFAAIGTEKLCSRGRHFRFCAAGGTLIKYFMKTFCSERLGYTDPVILLVFILIVGECFSDACVYLFCG